MSVTDGDTIRVEIDGTVFPLRYIGMDSPETVSPAKPVQWMGKEATAVNKSLVEGATVVLERDVSETDRFDRLLRYVWIERGGQWLLVNRELVRLGFAISKAYPPDTRYQSLLDAAQQEARGAHVALWAATPAPIVPFLAQVPPPATPGPAGNCDPSYPTVCIPPAPPDLNCGDITFRRFQVLAPDPHGFDGDHDGIGCESG
jgi:endonuclease YncB( thermonuclease family)